MTYPEISKWTTQPKKYAEEGSVLVSVRAPVGPTNLAPTVCAIGRGLAALNPRGDVASEFVLWAMRASETCLAEQATGTTFGAITGSQLKEHRLPVAPLVEQQRIVAHIEASFACIDTAEEKIRSAVAKTAAMRRSILTQAFTGQLVPQD